MAKIAIGSGGEVSQPECIKALVAEFIATFLFVFSGVASAITADKLVGEAIMNLFVVAVAHALVTAAMISASFQISGGHLNPAVTLGLAVGGHISLLRSSLYLLSQLLASSAACYSLRFLTGLGTPVHALGEGVSSMQGVGMELVLTFSLVFTVYGTIVDTNKASAGGAVNGMGGGPLLVGLLVGANIVAGGSFSGASMNPARSFGPALVMGVWTDHWVYWVGPLSGSLLAGFLYQNFFTVKHYTQPTGEDDDDMLHY